MNTQFTNTFQRDGQATETGSLPPVVCPRWVKASERLPERCGEENKVIIRDISETYHFVGEGFRNFNTENPAIYFTKGYNSYLTVDGIGNYQSTWPVKNIEWLDESPTPPIC